MGREKVLITVKTYPTLSRKHGELVCTAGVREDGSWVRLYPIPFRLLDYKDRYQKFDWIETRLVRNTKDPRPETFHLADTADIQQIGRMETVDNWRERRDLMLKKAKVYDRLEPLIAAAHANQLSLAVFKPTKILDFVWESDDREWDQSKVDAMRSNADQAELFEGDTWRQTFKLMPKLPFKFSYRFEDAAGKPSEMRVLDWETGRLRLPDQRRFISLTRQNIAGDCRERLRPLRVSHCGTIIGDLINFGRQLGNHPGAVPPRHEISNVS